MQTLFSEYIVSELLTHKQKFSQRLLFFSSYLRGQSIFILSDADLIYENNVVSWKWLKLNLKLHIIQYFVHFHYDFFKGKEQMLNIESIFRKKQYLPSYWQKLQNRMEEKEKITSISCKSLKVWWKAIRNSHQIG